eukprot:gene17095-17285_t
MSEKVGRYAGGSPLSVQTITAGIGREIRQTRTCGLRLLSPRTPDRPRWTWPEKPTGEPTMKQTRKSNRPSHAVYLVEGEGESAYWTKIGAAWAHEDGEGFNLQLAAVPLNGRLVIRKPKAQADREVGR